MTLQFLSSEKPKPVIVLRDAAEADLALLYAWRHHPETRQFCRRQDPLSWEDYIAELRGVMTAEGSHLLVAEHGGHSVGVLRLDGSMEDVEISITVAPGLRGRGFGRAMLEEMKRRFPDYEFSAYILADNVASGRLFGSVGFMPKFDGWWLLPRNADRNERHAA